jgi:hypothetical protein
MGPYRAVALVLLAATMLAVFAGCDSWSTSISTSTPPSSRELAIFRGSSGNTETAHFITNGLWEMYWTCDPGPSGYPFSVRISVMNGGPSPVMTPVATTCDNPSGAGSVGTVDVHQAGEVWLDVAASADSDDGGTWIAIISVPASDMGAQLVSSLPPTVLPTPTDMPPPVATLPPLSFSGQGTE